MKQVQINASGSYPICIGSGIWSSVSRILRETTKANRVCIVSDQNVAAIYGRNLCDFLDREGFAVSLFTFSSGEHSKNMRTYTALLNFLVENGLDRKDCIIALGGGVTGDLAGFAAATYLRGIAYIQMPTSLLAMVDSSVGGKTGVNLSRGKNLCGAFHQPVAVVCDTAFLETLPREEFLNGCGEIIKYAVLFDEVLFAHLEEKGENFDRLDVITRCIEWKRDVVSLDEFETGQRKLLNLGHTIGHAIERCSRYAIPHGSAVATGIAMVAKASGCRDTERIHRLLHSFGLPVKTNYTASRIYRCLLSDKKRSGDSIHMIIPKSIGDCAIVPYSFEKLKTFMEAGF